MKKKIAVLAARRCNAANIVFSEEAGSTMVLSSSDSLDALKDQVRKALQDTACVCDPMAESCQCAEGGRCSCDDMWCWIQDIFSDRVVYSLASKLYARNYTKGADGAITLSAPTAVEIAYKAIGESHREIVRETVQLKEAQPAYDKTTGRLTLTLIESGFNTSKSKYYTKKALKTGHQIFEGAKMFVNHQTEAEKKARPEGSVNDWAGQVDKTWVEEAATGKTVMRGSAVIIDPPFKEKLETLQEAGLLNEMGVSIRAIGSGQEADIPLAEGGTARAIAIDEFVKARSVDFVTYAGAGGRCEVLESDTDEFDIELADSDALRRARPDLVELIESTARGDSNMQKTAEQQLAEAIAEKNAANARATAAETQLAEATKLTKRTTATAALTTLLEKAKLPAVAQERLKKQFEAAESDTGMAEAVEAERKYIAKVAGVKVTDLGETDNEVEEVEETAGEKGGKKKYDFVESFVAMGLTEAEAKIAAKGL
jgi:hypothetical protein